MTTRENCVSIVFLLAVFSATLAFSQEHRRLSTVQDGSGVLSTNTVSIHSVNYRHVSAGSQPGGVSTSTNGTFANYAGFLQAVDIKRPNLDTDNDGVSDELSTDNDGDGLTDIVEIEGSNFQPATVTEVNIADTDGDGVTDGGEAIAGTDPTDDQIYLQILDIRNTGGNREISYMAREGKEYHIRAADGSYRRPITELGTQQEPRGGSGDWLVRTNIYTDVDATNQRSYVIEAQK